jgi:hypothetical protein
MPSAILVQSMPFPPLVALAAMPDGHETAGMAPGVNAPPLAHGVAAAAAPRDGRGLRNARLTNVPPT